MHLANVYLTEATLCMIHLLMTLVVSQEGENPIRGRVSIFRSEIPNGENVREDIT